MTSEWKIPSFDELFMREVYAIARKSKDPRSKIGAVLVKNDVSIMKGYNGIPRKVNDDIEERHINPEKFFWYEHAERNCFYHCARYGIATEGTKLYCMGMSCAECCRAIIHCGVKELIIHSPWDAIEIKDNREKWVNTTKRSRMMFDEVGIIVREYDKYLGVETMVNGKIYIV